MKALLIEKEEFIAEVLKNCLLRYKIKVTVVQEVCDAMEIIPTDDFNLIIYDFWRLFEECMPDVIKLSKLKEIPMILVITESCEAMKERFLELPLAICISKPLALTNFHEAINSVIKSKFKES